MIVQCPACSSRYRINEDKIQGRGARITCPSCGHKFVVEKAPEAAARGVPVALQRGDEDDEADVPTTVMPQGSAMLQAARRAPEPAPAPAPAPTRAPAARASAPAAPAKKAGTSPVVVIAVAVVALAVVGVALAALFAGG